MDAVSKRIHLVNMCRTCMQQQNGTVVLQSIYEFLPGIEQNKNILELLRSATPQLIIQKTDNLPKNICKQCVDQMIVVRNFQQMVINSDKQIRALLVDTKFSELCEVKADKTHAKGEIRDPLQDIVDSVENHFKADKVLEHDGDILSTINENFETEYLQNISADSSDNSYVDSDWEKKNKHKAKINENCNGITSARRSTRKRTKHLLEQTIISDDAVVLSDTTILKQKLNKQLYPCSMCECSYTNASHVRRHERKKHNLYKKNPEDVRNKTFACSKCNSRYTQQRHLNRHLVQKHNEIAEDSQNVNTESWPCDECPRKFAKLESLRMHKRSHTKRIEYTCETCEQIFKTYSAYIKHTRTHNTNLQNNDLNSGKPYVCEYCNKAFHQTSSFKDHLRIHTGEMPYLCSECGKSFNNNSNLKQHLLRHNDIKRYECSDCPKRFRCPSDLGAHRAVHKKCKPHACDVCDASFAKPSQLKFHKMFHNGEKPHKCEYCEMRFVSADHMRRHMRTHTGEKPYQCKYCERAYAQSNDLIKHLRTHLGENVYRCELCPQAFRLAMELREHFAEHKNDDEETRQRNLNALQNAQTELTEKCGVVWKETK